MTDTDWESHEKYVQEVLSLDSTSGSGNKWNDPSDGASNKPHGDEKFPMMVDCKATVQKGYRLDRKFLDGWREKAESFGHLFSLPVRFYYDGGHSDWIVVPLDDFVALKDGFSSGNSSEEGFVRPDTLEFALSEMWDMIYEIDDPNLKSRLFDGLSNIDRKIPGKETL